MHQNSSGAGLEILNQRYVLVDEPAREGGQAIVRRAIDMRGQQQPVAIKIFPRTVETNSVALEAYSRESGALLKLDHPNIVRILDGGSIEDGRRFLVLEWLDSSLSDRIPFEGWDTFFEKVAGPVLEALVHAYSRNIIHRDLKPGNILFDADGLVRVADFGISKLLSFVSPGLTLQQFRSQPYAPPEFSDGLGETTRDVFGFGALCVASLSPNRLHGYEELAQALVNFDAPPEVAGVIERCLAQDPNERYQNIVELRDVLSAIQERRRQGYQPRRLRCGIKFLSKAQSHLRATLGKMVDAPRAAIKDLNTICGIRSHEKLGPEHFRLYAGQFCYHAQVDQGGGHLVIHQASEWEPSRLESYREAAWWEPIEFYLVSTQASPPNDRQTISIISQGVADLEARNTQHSGAIAAEKIFGKWLATLHAKSEIEQQRETPISYDGLERRGNRLRLRTTSSLDAELIGQSRIIEIPSERAPIAGEIESIDGEYLVLWCEAEPSDDLPVRGRLSLDTRAERRAIHRQRQSLDSVRFGRCARPELRDFLIQPELVKPPSESMSISVSSSELDESKRSAVAKALGADSFLVVEGPPGTGKTSFITEVVKQTLSKSPNARILLTSQTHVALDHALEKLRSITPLLKMVRIGHRNDSRISDGVADLLLENRVEEWLKNVRAQSKKYIDQRALELNVKRSEIDLGMAAARLRASMENVAFLETRAAAIARDVEELERTEATRAAREVEETFQETREALREIGEQQAELLGELRRAREDLRDAKKELLTLPDIDPAFAEQSAHELREWEAALLESDDASREMHRLISLAEEWYLRFGRSRDFAAALIADSQVVASTCLGFGGIRGIQEVDFDLCIVDEASKATVTELLVPIARARKWIVVGDRNQLPPYVDDANMCPRVLEAHGVSRDDLKVTLLDVLSDRLPPAAVTKLRQQHRMIRPIGDLISACFYDGDLESPNEGDPSLLAPALPRPVAWFSTTPLQHRMEQSERGSIKNNLEVKQVEKLLRQIAFMAHLRRRTFKVAVLAAYAAQRDELHRMIDRQYNSLSGIEIECNTVDAFQGREADIAIYSVTRSNRRGELGFLRERRRLNVALSRAKYGLAIVGDASFVRAAAEGEYNPWTKVLDYIESHPKDCCIQEVSL